MPTLFGLPLNIFLACLLWMGLIYLFVRLTTSLNRSVEHLKRVHAIPCTRCRYFTGEMLLKCPVNPKAALTEQALGCPDFVGEVD